MRVAAIVKRKHDNWKEVCWRYRKTQDRDKRLEELIKLNDLVLKPDEQSRDKVQVETYADIVKKSPSEEKINEKEYNCMGCSFQGTEESELRRHVHIKHTHTSNGNNQDDC